MLSYIDERRLWLFTKFGTTNYSSVRYERGDWLLFGSETSGLPQTLRSLYESQCVSLPMIGPVRSLNLSVSVGIGMYEAYRQIAG
jgi:tRNA (cytidine/uridine-2'-O-)-methyltransferase